LALMGRSDAAIAELKRAYELDPLSLIINLAVGWIYYLGVTTMILSTMPEDSGIGSRLYTRALLPGSRLRPESLFDRAIEEFTSNRLVGRDPGALAVLGFAYGVSGRTSDARELLDELKDQLDEDMSRLTVSR